MTARGIRPHSLRQHELIADQVLARYAEATRWQPSLPVPVEQIIERCYDLRIAWEVLHERPGDVILGALDPSTKTIYMNETHAESILDLVGPRNFTFAHELGHWLYDAVPPEQGTLLDDRVPMFCRGVAGLANQDRLREVNANKFASCLLLPRGLVLPPLAAAEWTPDIRRTAKAWGVSQQTLAIRIEELDGSGRQVRSQLSL